MLGYILGGALVAIVISLVVTYYEKILAFGTGSKKFYYEVRQEMRKVSWPSQDEVFNSTVIVSIATVAMLVVIGVCDGVVGRLVAMIFGVQ